MSSEAISRQTPINGTIQQIVKPGNQTGLYYITVSNLPWSTSWQQLKDHVRTICEVFRVEVFNDSTSGWVCLQGRENFDAAFRLLNGGVFNGRALFADGKNATEPVWIKELVPAGSGSSPRTPRTSRPTPPPGTQAMVSPTTPGYDWTTTAARTTAMDYGTYAAPVSMPLDYGAATYHNYASNGRYYDQSAYDHSAVAIPVSQYPHDTSYQHQYQAEDYRNNGYSTYTNGTSAPGSGVSRSSGTSTATVPTRRRKIIMKQLPSWATYNQVQHLVRQKAGSDADKLQQIDLPLSNGQESNRGYALVTFENEDAANKVIRKLNGYEYDGRTLRVEHTKEGVSANESSSSRSKGSSGHHTSSSSSHHRERRDDRDRRDKKESTKVSSSSDKKTQSHKSHKSNVIIADGSSSSSKKYEEKKSGRKH
ncbi:Uu.00g002910.m01.CDS01 [Anthostomella pinea]|uniref:Uu.00g002910.m01.CDS01 n=1 Tax=Anthostomella pinea TaxID=933095 RepID=A0AAI8VKM2_9PEZI|nr:Uu.00g002910.m01.CDS01 [Anthostomella pinea]